MDEKQADFWRRVVRVVEQDGVVTEADRMGDRILKLETHAIKASKLYCCNRAMDVAERHFMTTVAIAMGVDTDFLRYDLGVAHIGRLQVSPRAFAPYQHRIWAESGRTDDLQAVADKAFAETLAGHFETPWELYGGWKTVKEDMIAKMIEMHKEWE